jgi:hypothetical protein
MASDQEFYNKYQGKTLLDVYLGEAESGGGIFRPVKEASGRPFGYSSCTVHYRQEDGIALLVDKGTRKIETALSIKKV